MFSKFRQRAARAIDAVKANQHGRKDHELDKSVNISPHAEEEEEDVVSRRTVYDTTTDMNLGDSNNSTEKEEKTRQQHFLGENSIAAGFANMVQPSQAPEPVIDDPDILRLYAEVEQLRNEVKQTKESGSRTRKRRQLEANKLRSHINGKSRELWFAKEKSKRFGLNEYKSYIKKCSLPCHDMSAAVMNTEAKLLRARHNGIITEHQHKVLHEYQQGMIDYMHTTALPEIRNERELAEMVGKSQVDKMRASKDKVMDLYEDCLGLQRKIIAKHKLRELEHLREHRDGENDSSADADEDSQDIEMLRVAAGEIPTMERQSELRDSAKGRLQAKQAAQNRLKERRKTREKEVFETTKVIEAKEKETLAKAQEHIARISTHSVDLDLDDEEGKSSDNGPVNNYTHETDPSHSLFGEESTRSFASVSNHQRPSLSGDDARRTTNVPDINGKDENKEPKRRSSISRPTPVASVGGERGKREDLLQRARSTRLHSGSAGVGGNTHSISKPRPALENRAMSPRRLSGRKDVNEVSEVGASETSRRARPNLGSKALSTRDFSSSRRTAGARASARGGLGASEHIRRSGVGNSEHKVRSRPSLANVAASATSTEREARLERLASRRRLLTDASVKKDENGDNIDDKKSSGMSAERRAHLRSSMRRAGGLAAKGKLSANATIGKDSTQ